MQEACELALDVYQTADGRPITLAMVERRLEQLLAHRPGCWCGRCELAAKARADDVSFGSRWGGSGRWL